MKTSRSTPFYIILSILLFVVTLIVIISFRFKEPATLQTQPQPIPTVTNSAVPWNWLVQEKETISVDTMEEELRATGFLISYEYFFTDLLTYENVISILLVGHSTTSYSVSYDGVVTAGVDFSKITVSKDEENKIITISIPQATIKNVDIDPYSMQVHTEHQGFANPISVNDFNKSIKELENKARSKAQSRGILSHANENAKLIIQNMVTALLGNNSDYFVKYVIV